MMEDVMFGLMLAAAFAAPFMAAINLTGHFCRSNMFIYELICYMIGIPLTLWFISNDSIIAFDCPTPVRFVYLLLPFAAAAYLYTKYGRGNKILKIAAKTASLASAAAFALISVYMWADVFSSELDIYVLVVFYATLVPLNYAVTAVSESVFQMLDAGGTQKAEKID